MSLIDNVKRAIISGSGKGAKSANSSSTTQLNEIEGRQGLNGCSPQAIAIASFWGVDDYISASDWIELYDSISTDYEYNDLNKIIRLGGYLRKYALSWYVETIKQYEKIEEIEWEVLKDNFKKHFILCMNQSKSEASSVVSSFDTETC